ncbi:MAG: hypothetical protein FWE31_04365 [Firmicutes bacterium]|nr:hypothetical protein [Bacillota bacterium]
MKRTMARVTGIVAIVFASIGILMSIIFMSAAYTWSLYWTHSGWSSFRALNTGLFVFWLIFGLLLLALCITQIVLSAKLIQKTNDTTNTPADFNGLLIAVTIMSFFAGGWIPLILGIIALCMNNAEAGVEAIAHAGSKGVATGKGAGKAGSEFDQAVGRLKQYKADGIIDEVTYKKKMDELFQKHYMGE